MQRSKERGEGRLGSVIWLVALAAAIYAAWHVGPAYLGHYQLKDQMMLICRSPRGTNTDEKLLDQLVKDTQELGLSDYVARRNFRIQTFDTSRKISVDYQREVEVLPGYRRILRFNETVEQPLVF